MQFDGTVNYVLNNRYHNSFKYLLTDQIPQTKETNNINLKEYSLAIVHMKRYDGYMQCQ